MIQLQGQMHALLVCKTECSHPTAKEPSDLTAAFQESWESIAHLSAVLFLTKALLDLWCENCQSGGS